MGTSAEGAIHRYRGRTLRIVVAVGPIVMSIWHIRFRSHGYAGFLDLLTIAVGAMILVAEITVALSQPDE